MCPSFLMDVIVCTYGMPDYDFRRVSDGDSFSAHISLYSALCSQLATTRVTGKLLKQVPDHTVLVVSLRRCPIFILTNRVPRRTTVLASG